MNRAQAVELIAVIFALASASPMSVFVLNLATLLGLGLGALTMNRRRVSKSRWGGR